jgi:hypothetical protein
MATSYRREEGPCPGAAALRSARCFSAVQPGTAQDDVLSVFEREISTSLKELVRRRAASSVVMIVVDQDDAARTYPVCHAVQAVADRVVPVAVDMGEGDLLYPCRRESILEQTLMQADRRAVDGEAVFREGTADFIVKTSR